MRKNPLRDIRKKLENYHISSLSATELQVYFEHRLETIVRKKYVLTFKELTYLLSETGPGDRRFDPRTLPLLTKAKTFVNSRCAGLKEMEELMRKKIDVDEHIEGIKDSDTTRIMLVRLLSNYIDDVVIVSEKPFIITGTFNEVPLSLFIKNGDWVLPNKELFTFLKQTKENKRFPVIIAKKISGILFPVFRGISILGLNLYKIYLPEQSREIIRAANLHHEIIKKELKYNDQFEFISSNTQMNENGDGPIKNFFEVILTNNLVNYYEEFLQSKITLKDTLPEIVLQFRKNKATKNLLNSFHFQESALKELKLKNK
jgi:hypothetical protein